MKYNSHTIQFTHFKYTSTFQEDSAECKEGSSCPSQSQGQSQNKGFEGKGSSAERGPQPGKKKEEEEEWHVSQLPMGQRCCGSEGSPNILGRAPGETSLTTTPSESSPKYWVSREEDRRQQHTNVHCGCQGQQAPDQTGCEEALWHWHGQGQPPDQAWWREEGLCSTGSQLGCSGCCQQNWDHLNWGQLANSKYKNFHLKKSK